MFSALSPDLLTAPADVNGEATMTPESRGSAGKAGRLTDYTDGLANIICERIADGESLRSICSEEEMPAKSTVFEWLARHDEFRTKYALAREAQADALVDEMVDIADDGRNDWMEKRNADGEVIGWRENGEAMRRSDLRVKTRQWVAAKLQPKKYGDFVRNEHSGPDGGAVVTEIVIRGV